MSALTFTRYQSAVFDDMAAFSNHGTGQHLDVSERQLAWQRAMEQAEKMTWFSHPDVLVGAMRHPPDNVSQQAFIPVASAALSQTAGQSHVRAADYQGREDTPALSVAANSYAHPVIRAGASDSGGAGASPSWTAVDIHGNDSRGSVNGTGSESEAWGALVPEREYANFTFAQTPYHSFGGGALAMLNDSGALEDKVQEYAEDALTPVVRWRETGPAGAPQREPMRIHAEWEEQGVRVWIGMDLDQNVPLAQLTRLLTRQLQRRFAEHGVSLLSLVCNGQLVGTSQQSESSTPQSRKTVFGNSSSGSPPGEDIPVNSNLVHNTPKESS